MLDHISIFTKTGIILWSRSLCKLQGSPVEELIDTVLMEEKGGEKAATIGAYRLKWDFVNDLDVVFVVVYSKLLTLLYVDDLLANMKKALIANFKTAIVDTSCVRIDFNAEFDRALNDAEIQNMQQKKLANVGKQLQHQPKSLNSSAHGTPRSSTKEIEVSENGNGDNEEGDEDDEEDLEDITEVEESDRKEILAKLQNRARGAKKSTGPIKKSGNSSTATPSSPPKKEARVWAGGKMKSNSKVAASLDRSKQLVNSDNSTDSNDDQEKRELEQSRLIYLPNEGERPMWEIEAEEAKEFQNSLMQNEINEKEKSTTSPSGWFGKSYLGDLLQSVTGNKVLEQSDLDPVLEKIKESLQGKNVAAEIAEDICASVGTSLIGHKLASFTRIHTVVTDSLIAAVQRVLTPKTSTDILRQVLDAKAEGKVFSAVFVGINGVGKSTSLAKVAYYLKCHGVKVMIAACDTFRSGAVEQLRTHGRCLDVPLFEMGYAKDASRVATAALQEAAEKKFDCVLIDTAGRMQNNEPLMRALAKLITENEPNLVLFVGEALVGNDGIDQLSMFDQALVNYSPPGKTHHIDGIVLTKFDTIDDKVGAALSMSYKSAKPIMFVGTGQKYTHLKKLNVNTVIKHLFSM